MPRKLAPDLWLFGTAVVLLSTGVVMVYSASAIVAADRFHDPYFFLKKQIFWAMLGAACLWLTLCVDYRRLEGLVVPLLIVSAALLVLVLLPPIGQAINGTRRWIRLGPVSFQPAELAKLTLVVYLAAFLAKNHEALDHFRQGLLPPLVVAGMFGALVLAQPDLGNCLTLIALTFALLFLAGGRLRHLGLVLAPAVPLTAIAIWAAPHRASCPRPLRRVPCPWDHGADRDPNAREPGCRDGPPADERAAAALHLVWWLGAARHDALDRSAVEHLPARPCLSATSRFTSSASGAPGCPASPRSS